MSFALTTAGEITGRLDALIADIWPGAVRLPKYGGILFQKDPGDAHSMVCGHFTYKAHVGLEFSEGYRLDDIHDVLEGGGKYRRHIKLTDVGDIEEKHVADYLRQAFFLT